MNINGFRGYESFRAISQNKKDTNEIMKNLDADHDGKLSREEVKGTLWEGFFDVVDKKKDGSIGRSDVRNFLFQKSLKDNGVKLDEGYFHKTELLPVSIPDEPAAGSSAAATETPTEEITTAATTATTTTQSDKDFFEQLDKPDSMNGSNLWFLETGQRFCGFANVSIDSKNLPENFVPTAGHTYELFSGALHPEGVRYAPTHTKPSTTVDGTFDDTGKINSFAITMGNDHITYNKDGSAYLNGKQVTGDTALQNGGMILFQNGQFIVRQSKADVCFSTDKENMTCTPKGLWSQYGGVYKGLTKPEDTAKYDITGHTR